MAHVVSKNQFSYTDDTEEIILFTDIQLSNAVIST